MTIYTDKFLLRMATENIRFCFDGCKFNF